MSYRGARDMRQIGRALNISHVLEGSIRRQAGRIHVNTQLVDARTDTHVWAEQYDRDLNEVFEIQERNRAKGGGAASRQSLYEPKNRRLSVRPRPILCAFDLYTRAKNLFLAATNSNSGKEDLLEAADLLNQALARDPSYFEAYCQLGGIHDLLYILGDDHSSRRLALAETAIDAALRLRPNAGEAHLGRAVNLYSGYLNYDEALTELELARKSFA